MSRSHKYSVLNPDTMTKEELRSEVLSWRSLYLDQPEDRLYHAKDDTWWSRRDDTYLGVGALYRAEPPPGYTRR